jgi:hypothetical protein
MTSTFIVDLDTDDRVCSLVLEIKQNDLQYLHIVYSYHVLVLKMHYTGLLKYAL